MNLVRILGLFCVSLILFSFFFFFAAGSLMPGGLFESLCANCSYVSSLAACFKSKRNPLNARREMKKAGLENRKFFARNPLVLCGGAANEFL